MSAATYALFLTMIALGIFISAIITTTLMLRWFARRSGVRGKWYMSHPICPMCGDWATPHYHGPRQMYPITCTEPDTQPHNHMRCSCGFEWTLPPRDPAAAS